MTRSVVDLARSAAEASRPEQALAAIAELRHRLDELEEYYVEQALRRGASWARIGLALGISKQAAHKRHAGSPRSAVAGRTRDRKRVTVTAQARESVWLARTEAAALGERSLGTEHLLLGLIRLGGRAAEALGALGVSLDAAREAVAQHAQAAGRGGGKPAASPAAVAVSARTKAVFEQALREAVRRDEMWLGDEHLLLALLRQRAGAAVRVLTDLGAPPRAVEARLEQAGDPATPAPVP